MKYLTLFLFLLTALTGTAWAGLPPGALLLDDFTAPPEKAGWAVEDDVVMGGRSQGILEHHPEGYAIFSGEVSLENDGGFSSIQRFFPARSIEGYETAVLRVKGDGKTYQFRVQSSPRQRHAYIHEFETSGEWQTLRIPLREMRPVWRGNALDLPPYPAEHIGHLRFFIANGRAESFRLLVDSVWLE